MEANGQTINLVRTALEAGRSVLVIGVKPGERQHWPHADDPRIVYWNSGKKLKRLLPPRRTGVVLMTRYTDHSVTQRIRQAIPADAVFYTRHMSSGELKALLEQAYVPPVTRPSVSDSAPFPTMTVVTITPPRSAPAIEPASESVEPVTPAGLSDSASVSVRKERGWVTEFVRKNANFEVKPISTEIDRLWEAVKKEHHAVARPTVHSAFYRLKGAAKNAAPTRKVTARKKTARVITEPRQDSSEILGEFIKLAQPTLSAVREILTENRRLREELVEQKRQLEAIKQAVSRLK